MLQQVAQRWGREVLHVFDRGYGSKGWIGMLGWWKVRFVIRWKKGHLFRDQNGQEKKLWEVARGKRAWEHREVWDEEKKCSCKMGVLAVPVRHAGYAGELWVVVGRRKGEPWYLITNERVETVEHAWHLIFVYARRWQIELSFRYGKSELQVESVRMREAEERDKLLLLVTLAYSYLLSLLVPAQEERRKQLFRAYYHRTGKRSHRAKLPLYRLRWALSRLWLEVPPCFSSPLFHTLAALSNTHSESSG